MGTKREGHIDAVRGIGIVLMILGHIPLSVHYDHFIHAFHMPMFFIISGYFFRRPVSWPNTVVMIKKKAKKLLIPYVVFGTVYYLVWYMFIRNESLFLPLRSLLFFNTDDHMPIGGALWFLTSMFLADTGYRLICLVVKGKERFVIAGLIGVIGCYLSSLECNFPWGGDAAIVAIGFYGIGDLAREYWDTIEKSAKQCNGFVLFLFAFLLYGLIMKNGYINMRVGNYGIVPLFWFNAIAVTFNLIFIMGFVYNVVIRSEVRIAFFLRLLLQYVMFVGRNSLLFLCLNQLILWFLRNAIPDCFVKNYIMFSMTMCCITTIIQSKRGRIANWK